VAANPIQQQETLDELMTMIKALERLKESRPSLTFVKTGVSSSPLPKFLVDQDIISEKKRMYSPSPLKMEVANVNHPITTESINALPKSKGHKKVLKKSLHLKKLKAKQIEKKKETRSNRPNLYSEQCSRGMNKKRRHTGIWRWLEELAIIMSKMSLFGLFLILLLLSGVFFGVGFLAAISNMKGESSSHPTTWQQASQNQNTAGTDGKPNPFLKAAGGIASSFVNQKVASIESKLGGGLLNTAVQKVPPSLQPFALHMQNKFSQQSQAIVNSGGRSVNRIFRPSPFGTTPPPSSGTQAGSRTSHHFLPTIGQLSSSPQPHTPDTIHRYTPSQQAFMQAGQQVGHQAMHPQQSSSYRPGPQGSIGPSSPSAHRAAQPYTDIHASPGLPHAHSAYSPPQGYYTPPTMPIQSQPYGISQPYGYSQASQEPPKMIGMG
jgi:hypothetical protein